MLRAAARDIRATMAVAREVNERRRALGGRGVDCGSPRLASALDELLQAWGREMGQMVHGADKLAHVLEAMAALYVHVESSSQTGPH